jgi:KDO2-lipid IV(A) lauroyltransferase
MLIRLLTRLPLPLLYTLADILFVVFFRLLRFQRRLVEDNLRGAFPEQSPAAIRRLAAHSYRNAIHILFETIRCFSFSDRDLAQRVEIENMALIDTLRQQHGTVLAAASHQCNWEWLQLACAARLEAPLAVIYKPLNHQGIDALLAQLRRRHGTELIEARNSLSQLIRFAQTPGVIALVADQAPRREEEKYWSRFLGRDTAFLPGLEKLARFLKAPVVFVHMSRLRRGHYRIRFEVLTEPPYRKQNGEIMQPYIQAVEKQIIEAPQDWFWVYKRWKHKKPAPEARP